MMENGDPKLAVEVGVETVLAMGFYGGGMAQVEMANDAWPLPGPCSAARAGDQVSRVMGRVSHSDLSFSSSLQGHKASQQMMASPPFIPPPFAFLDLGVSISS